MLEIHHPSLLVLLVARPRPNGPLVRLLMHVHKARLLERGFHRVERCERAACSLAACVRDRAPASEDGLCGETVVVALDRGAGF